MGSGARRRRRASPGDFWSGPTRGERPAGATDDASLVEACGAVVRLVPDSARNLKITTREDLALAEALAAAAP